MNTLNPAFGPLPSAPQQGPPQTPQSRYLQQALQQLQSQPMTGGAPQLGMDLLSSAMMQQAQRRQQPPGALPGAPVVPAAPGAPGTTPMGQQSPDLGQSLGQAFGNIGKVPGNLGQAAGGLMGLGRQAMSGLSGMFGGR